MIREVEGVYEKNLNILASEMFYLRSKGFSFVLMLLGFIFLLALVFIYIRHYVYFG